MSVKRDNPNARRFYEARSFRPTGELVDVYLGHEFHDVEMGLPPDIEARDLGALYR